MLQRSRRWRGAATCSAVTRQPWLSSSLRSATQSADLALTDVRKVEAEKLRSPVEPLRYQRQLLENLRLLEVIEQELSPARLELAALMGMAPGQAATAWRVTS